MWNTPLRRVVGVSLVKVAYGASIGKILAYTTEPARKRGWRWTSGGVRVLTITVTAEAQRVIGNDGNIVCFPRAFQQEILGAAVRPPRIAVVASDGHHAVANIGI